MSRLVVAALCCVAGATACVSTSPSRAPRPLSDEALVHCLASGGDCPGDLPKEVFKRGESVLPELMKLKGDRRPYAGGFLGRPNSATWVYLSPTGNPEFDRKRVLTNEVAALYLICAIYEGRLDFADSPYLSDARLPPDRRETTVAPELVARAWAAVDEWMRALAAEGLSALRQRSQGPLAGSEVFFW